MANEEHLEILKKGVPAWNAWRKENPDIRPDLREAKLYDANFNLAILTNADLSYANLSRANLFGADLEGANCASAGSTRQSSKEPTSKKPSSTKLSSTTSTYRMRST